MVLLLLTTLKADENLLDIDRMTAKDLAKAHNQTKAFEAFTKRELDLKLKSGTVTILKNSKFARK
jgi:hypothetical protein